MRSELERWLDYQLNTLKSMGCVRFIKDAGEEYIILTDYGRKWLAKEQNRKRTSYSQPSPKVGDECEKG